jgi:hypothetical protein
MKCRTRHTPVVTSTVAGPASLRSPVGAYSRTGMCASLRLLTASALGFWLGCASTPPESPEEVQADVATAHRVYVALASDPKHLYIGLDVQVHRGAAYLMALTFDAAARDEATHTAGLVAGVNKVVNEIEVSAGSAR